MKNHVRLLLFDPNEMLLHDLCETSRATYTAKPTEIQLKLPHSRFILTAFQKNKKETQLQTESMCTKANRIKSFMIELRQDVSIKRSKCQQTEQNYNIELKKQLS